VDVLTKWLGLNAADVQQLIESGVCA